MIKKSALRLLSPPSPTVSTAQSRLEKSVQTSSCCTTLPAEAFAPELPPPDLAEFHDADGHLDVGSSVDNFVDALFDFEPKLQVNNNSSGNAVLKRFPGPRFAPPKDLSWGCQDFVGCWEKSRRIAMPWTVRSIQHMNSLRELGSPSKLEDMMAIQESASISHRMQKKWSRLHSDAGLSMTTALSTAVGGVEQCCQENPQSEKKSKKRENEEWVIALLKMLEQKPAKSRKLLKGLINFSKEHKSTKSSKSRNHGHNSTPRGSDSEAPKGERAGDESSPAVSDSRPLVDVYEYMKMKLKEQEKTKKGSDITNEKEAKPKKVKKEKNQNDIRAYLVGKRIVEPTCKACGAQTDIREFLVGKKVKAVETVDVEPSTVASQTQPENSKTRRHKSSTKNNLVGKYVRLSKAATLAVVGESGTRLLGRLSSTTVAYGKSFRITNLSRKEMNLTVSPIDWPAHVQLRHPISTTVLAPGQTRDLAVTVTRSGVSAASECHLLSIVHRKTPVSATLTLKLDALAEHHEGPLLPDLYSPEEIRMITMFRPILNLPRPLEDSDEAETVHTVVNMLKDEVDSLCTGIISQVKISDSVRTSVDVGTVGEAAVENQLESSQLTDSVHTAIEFEGDEECDDEMRKVTTAEADDSAASDFEIVDVDEGGSISSDKEEDDVAV